MKIKYFIMMIAIMIAGVFSTSVSLDKTTLFNNLIKKYGNLRSVSFDFESANNTLAGKIQAKRGNKYILEMNDRNVVCDGKKIWNHSITDNNVIISNYSDMENSASLENFFFDFLNNYEPVALEEVSSSAKMDGYALTLKPRKENSAIDNVKEIKLYVNRSQELTAVEFETPTAKQFWFISNLKINPSLQESIFNFTAPENAEIITID